MTNEQIFQILLNAGLAAIAILLIGLATALARKVYQIAYLVKRPGIVLELTPPASGDKTLEATGQLILSLFSLLSNQRFYEKLIGRKDTCSPEIIATRSGGIRYQIHCHAKHAQNIEHLIASYLPEVRVKQVPDYASGLEKKCKTSC